MTPLTPLTNSVKKQAQKLILGLVLSSQREGLFPSLHGICLSLHAVVIPALPSCMYPRLCLSCFLGGSALHPCGSLLPLSGLRFDSCWTCLALTQPACSMLFLLLHIETMTCLGKHCTLFLHIVGSVFLFSSNYLLCCGVLAKDNFL